MVTNPATDPKSCRRILELVARNTTHCVIITDAQGQTTWVNEETERLTGYCLAELVGQKPGDLLQGRDTSSASIKLMGRAIRNREPFETTLVNYSKSGVLYWVRISCRPFYREDGALEGFISTQVDETRLRRLSEFNALHAAVNQVIATSEHDLSLFQSICELAVRHAHLELAWIGRPDSTGRFEYLARSGNAIHYLDGISISSDATLPEGQGPTGHTWREGRPRYSQSFSSTSSLKAWQKRARNLGLDASATMPIFRDGKVWAVFTVYHARSGIFDGELRNVLDAVASDISRGLDQIDLRRRERELAKQLDEEKELAQVTLASIEDGVVTTDNDGLITFVNQKAELLSGWTCQQAVGLPVTRVLRILEDIDGERVRDPIREVFRTKQAIHFGNHTVLVARDGSQRHIESSAAPIFTPERDLRGCVVIFRDVTERYEAIRRLEWQANHDALTGLPNRFALEKHLQASIEHAQRINGGVAVGLLDLDDFKPVNDQYGHETGDLVLKELAARIQRHMRDGDFLARLAGDELVVVIANLEPHVSNGTLDGVLSRLHEAVESPFELGADDNVRLGMSMGVALYPRDGQEVDGLLRQADAAMYSAKANKYSRTSWWRAAMLSLTSRASEEPIDPYGQVASDLLGKARHSWQGLEQEFVDAFYKRLQSQPRTNRVLQLLTDSEQTRLKEQQSEHLKRLISPALSWEAHRRMSIRVGEAHARTGVEGSEVMMAMDEYGRLLRYASQKLPWRVDARLALDSIMQSRLAAEVQFQSEGRDRIEQARVANTAGLEAQLQGWIEEGEFGFRLARHLLEMSCMCGVLIGRPDDRDRFVLEFKAGTVAASMRDMPESDPPAYGADKSGISMWRTAWLSGQVKVCERYEAGRGSATRDQVSDPDSIRSAAYVPILDAQGHPLVLIALFGTCPGQFTHPLMRMWIESIQHIVTPAFLRIERRSQAPIDATTRQRYHDLLFDHGLQIMVHPIVRLSSGQVEKVEVLARLRDGDQLFSPATFLPSFGQQDLQALFRKGLHQTMGWLVRWDRQDLCLSASLNLPPSVLISPDCSQWVAQELEAYGVAPERIYLELLETEDDAGVSSLRDEAISRLAELGVRLVMDDLGSGYSSLQRMRTLPFHSVKIDQQLVRSAPSEPERTVPFIGSLVRMAQSLDLVVVVEGLEDLNMVDMAYRLGADYGQGYAFSKPLLPENLTNWVGDWQASSTLDALETPLGQLATAYLRNDL